MAELNKCAADIIKANPELKKVLELTDSDTYEEVVQKAKQGLEKLALQEFQLIESAKALKAGHGFLQTALMGHGNKNLGRAFTAMLTAGRGVGKKAFNFLSVEDRAFARRLSWESRLSEAASILKPRMLGNPKSKEFQRNLMRAMRGQETPDTDANNLARIWKDLTDDIAEEYNVLGGGIKKLSDFGMPQKHNPAAISKVASGEWIRDTKPLLDKERIMKQFNLKDDEAYNTILDVVYDRISTDGFVKYNPKTEALKYQVARKVGNRHQASRVLHFKDGDSYIKYQDAFGDTNYYAGMMSYLDMMSKEMSMMEVFGPNSDAVFKQLKNYTIQKGHKVTGNFQQHVYDDLMGETIANVNSLSKSFTILRNLGYMRKLGYAALSAITDVQFSRLTSKMNGISSFKVMKRHMKNLASGGEADNQLALRLGIMSDFIMDRATISYRYGESVGLGMAAKAADFTMRATGLNHWTISGKAAFGLEFSANLADMMPKSWKELTPRLRAAMKRYSITPEDWAEMQQTELFIKDGAKFFDPQALTNREIQRKVVGMIHAETNFAIPEPNARVRAIIHQGTKGGTVAGEMLRSFGQLKTFPVTILASHWGRALSMEGTDRIKYLASMFAGTTILGAMAYQAKEIAKGRDARAWDDPYLWLRGLDQGGALGIVGDLVTSSFRKGGLTGTIAGPAFQDVDEVANFLFGTIEDVGLLEDKILERFVKTGAKIAQDYVPGQLWYTRLAMERAIFDAIQHQVNPDWKAQQRTQARKYRRKTQQKQWYKPTGKLGTLPQRAPDVTPKPKGTLKDIEGMF